LPGERDGQHREEHEPEVVAQNAHRTRRQFALLLCPKLDLLEFNDGCRMNALIRKNGPNRA